MARPKATTAAIRGVGKQTDVGPYPLPTQRRSGSRMSTMKNPSVIPDSDETYHSESSSIQPQARAKTAQSLVVVQIPSVTPFADHGKSIGTSTTSMSPTPLTSTRDASVDIDTPATSISTTPAEHASLRRSGRVAPGSALPSSLKRTRSTFELGDVNSLLATHTDTDLELATRLQDEEYRFESPKKHKTTSRKHNFSILDSDDDLSSLEFDIEEIEYRKKPVQRVLSGNTLDRAGMLNRTLTAPSKLSPRSIRSSLRHANSTMPDILDDDAVQLASGQDSDVSFVNSVSWESDEDQVDDDNDPLAQTSAIPLSNGLTGAQIAKLSPRTRHRLLPSRSQRKAGRFESHLSTRQIREREKLEHSHPEIETMWDDLVAVPKIVIERAEQPAHIDRTLKSFQLEGLNWMRQQEKTKWRGGLLGDEMGMGKTIQAVSLIMSDYPARNPTLVAVPPVALMQWAKEIEDYTNGKLKVLIYHGQNAKVKSLSVKDLRKYDVIMISYPGLESIYRKETKGWTRGENIIKEDSAIHAIKYHRLILDEAHSIKSRTTGVAKACFGLKAEFKWCLSGTPVQNRIGEFFSLLRFLEVKPFANYFCKSCPCSTLHWSVNEDMRCTHCNHRSLDHVSVFNQEILNPLTSDTSSQASRKEAMRKLRLLTDRIMLRRLKRDYTSSMVSPSHDLAAAEHLKLITLL